MPIALPLILARVRVLFSKPFILLCLLFILASQSVNSQEDYTIRINGDSYKIALDKPVDLMINGKKARIEVRGNDTLVFSDTLLTFQYPKGFSMAKVVVDEGIEQMMFMTAAGSGVIVQLYRTMSPTGLNEMMLQEVTKESVNYGFKMERKDYKRKVGGGQELNVDKAVLTYKDETNVYEITSFSRKDEGVLLMTIRMDDKADAAGEKLIDMMWKSLKFIK